MEDEGDTLVPDVRMVPLLVPIKILLISLLYIIFILNYKFMVICKTGSASSVFNREGSDFILKNKSKM